MTRPWATRGRFSPQVVLDAADPAVATRSTRAAGLLFRARNRTPAHIACHATADLASPPQSVFTLGDPHGPPVSVGTLSELRLSDAEHAVLSACETACTAPHLGDEALHLASALHVAGFRHVVGTLWAVPDRPALRFVRGFYRRLGPVDGVPGDGGPAAAVRARVAELRARYPGRPLAWAGYVHTGP